jgi:hypothetical protein
MAWRSNALDACADRFLTLSTARLSGAEGFLEARSAGLQLQCDSAGCDDFSLTWCHGLVITILTVLSGFWFTARFSLVLAFAQAEPFFTVDLKMVVIGQ